MVGWIDSSMRVIAASRSILPAPHVAARIAQFARQDRIVIQAVANALTDAQLRGAVMLPDPLPAPPAVNLSIAPQLDSLEPAARRMLTIAAHSVVDRVDVLLAAAAVEFRVVVSDAVSGAIEFRDGTYRFRDERVRSVLVATCSPFERTAIHRSLAKAARPLADPMVSAWHALQGGGPFAPSHSPHLAFASRLLRSGAISGAFEVAQIMSERATGELRTDALLLAARAAFAGGCLQDADERLAAAQAAADSATRARASELRENLGLARRSSGPVHLPGSAGRPWVEALSHASTSTADATAIEQAGSALAALAVDPEGADAAQATAHLGSTRATPSWPWRLIQGPLSPLIEAFVRARTIVLQVRNEDMAGAAGTLEDALARLPLMLMTDKETVDAVGAVVRFAVGDSEVITEALANRPGPLARADARRARLSLTSSAARLDAKVVPSAGQATEGPESALSPRQRQIFDLLLDGRQNQEIGDALGISPRTVEVHVTNMLRKLGARSRVELVSRTLRRSSTH